MARRHGDSRKQYLEASNTGTPVPKRKQAVTKVIGTLAALQLTLAVAPLAAQTEQPFPDRPTGMVTDVAGIIPADVEARITTRLTRLRDSTGGEVAVVTLPSIGDRAAADVALSIGRTWGVGGDYPIGDPRRNAGAVLLVVPRTEDRSGAVYLASGQGTEGFLTDAQAGRIVDAMIPQLRDGDYGGAIELGATLVTDLIARELGATDPDLLVERREHLPAGRILVIVLLVMIIVVAVLVSVGGAGGGGSGGNRASRGHHHRSRSSWSNPMIWGGGFGGGLGGGFGGGGFGGGFGGFGGGGGFSGGGAGRSF
jgi:uncharacterized protein